MIVLQVSSQITYTIDNKEVVCYTREENRTIAMLLVNSDYNKRLILNQYSKITAYEDLVIQYKNDSIVNCVYKVNVERDYARINNALDEQIQASKDLQGKVKRKNNWIWGLLTGNVVTLGTTIYLLTK